MTLSELYNDLEYVNQSREKRTFYASKVLAHPALLKYVLEILFMVDDPRSPKAGWIAEFAIRRDIALIHPYLDFFTLHMGTVCQDPAVRPVAKICECLALSYYKEMNTLTRKHLTLKHREQMIETGFDWMITNQKVAVKAYTMTTLFYLGTEIDWVHPELERLIEEGYDKESAAFKARCRHTKELLRKFKK